MKDIKQYPPVASSSGSTSVIQGSQGAGYKVYEDDNFQTGDSQAVHDIDTDLGRAAKQGYFANYGGGDVNLEISEDGVSYGDSFIVKAGTTARFENENIFRFRVTHLGTDTSYTSRFK